MSRPFYFDPSPERLARRAARRILRSLRKTSRQTLQRPSDSAKLQPPPERRNR